MTDLRSRFFSTGNHRVDQALGELARDVSDALSAIIPTKLVEFTALYAEPMPVGADHEPKMIIVGRVRLDSSPETPIAHGEVARFVWNASTKTCNVSSIDMLAVGSKYRFNMLMVG